MKIYKKVKGVHPIYDIYYEGEKMDEVIGAILGAIGIFIFAALLINFL